MTNYKRNLAKFNTNLIILNGYLHELGCLEKGESIKFNKKGWSKQKITCPDPKHIDNHPSANFNSKSKTIYCHVCKKKWKLEEVSKMYKNKIKQLSKDYQFKKNNKMTKTKAAKLEDVVSKSVKRVSKKRTSNEIELQFSSYRDLPGVYKYFVKENNIVAVYPYSDKDGLIQYYKFRMNPKSFFLCQIERWLVDNDDCHLDLRRGMQGVTNWFPYNLPKVLTAKNIIIAEGEKDCDNLQRWLGKNGLDSWAATTFIITDKKRIGKCCQHLKNKNVFLCADIDGSEKNYKGETYMYQTVGPIVSKVAKSTKVLELQLDPGEDVSDLIENNPDQLLTDINNIDNMPDWHLNYFIDESEVPKEVLDINKRQAVVRAAPKTAVLCENETSDNDDRPFLLYDIPGTREFFRNKCIPNPRAENDRRHKPSINLFDYWLAWPHRRTYDKIVFDPSGRGDEEEARETISHALEIFKNQSRMILPALVTPFLVARFLIAVEELKNEMDSGASSDVTSIRKHTYAVGKAAVRNSRKYAPYKTKTLRLMGEYYWLIGRQGKAYKWWGKGIQEGEKLGARPDLSRTYFEVGKHLLEPDSKYKSLNGIDAKSYLKRARTLFKDMDMKQDLKELDKIALD